MSTGKYGPEKTVFGHFFSHRVETTPTLFPLLISNKLYIQLILITYVAIQQKIALIGPILHKWVSMGHAQTEKQILSKYVCCESFSTLCFFLPKRGHFQLKQLANDTSSQTESTKSIQIIFCNDLYPCHTFFWQKLKILN